jgi:hypothetical protein
MAPRRGNSTSYHKSVRTGCPRIGNQTLDGRPTLPALEKMWWKSRSRDPFCVTYDRGKKASIKFIKGGAVAEALDFLADMTGDHAFKTAALALRGYGLAEGGLKQGALRLVKEQTGTAAWVAMPRMHSWKQVIKSVRGAAARTAVQLGIPGSSFEAVIEELRKTYPVWLKKVEDNAHAKQIQSGDTGRKLRVRFAVPSLGTDNEPITELMGVHFGQDGFGIAPDNRAWRRLIHQGSIALYGVIERGLGKNSETNNQEVR